MPILSWITGWINVFGWMVCVSVISATFSRPPHGSCGYRQYRTASSVKSSGVACEVSRRVKHWLTFTRSIEGLSRHSRPARQSTNHRHHLSV